MKSTRARYVTIGVIAAAIVIYILATGIYVVSPQQQAVVQRFGKVVRTGVLPGPHLKMPFPIERVRKVKVAEVKRLGIGFDLADQVSGRIPNPERLHFLTADRNIISARAMVQYGISEPMRYLFGTRDPQISVRAAGESALTEVCAGYHVEQVITVAKYEIQERTRKLAQELLDSYGVGVRITAVNLQSVGPPPEVAAAFKDVIDAKTERKRVINEAESYGSRVVLKAGGEAQSILSGARAYETENVKRAMGESQRFLRALEEYEKAPQVTVRRLYLEMVEEVFPRLRKMIVGPEGAFTLGVGRAEQ